MGDNGKIYFTDDVAARIAASGTAWVRLNFRLGPNFKDWTETTSFGFSALSCYDAIVNSALNHNLKVLGLLCNEAWSSATAPGSWRASSAEAGRGVGNNPYIAEFVTFAASKLFAHFAGRISHWQIWNEPNASTTYLYPSNFAWLLRRCYVAARDVGSPTLTIVSGAVLSTHGPTARTLTSSNTGADYLRNTYRMGKAYAGWYDVKKVYGSYPIDAIGQHLYIDQWSLTTAERVAQAASLVRKAYVAEEGGLSNKPIHITELGWSNDNVDENTQAANLKIAYLKLKQLPYTPLTYWFFLQDIPESRLGHGLLRSDGSEKPAWASFREINEIHVSPEPRTTMPRLLSAFFKRGQRVWQALSLRLR